LVDGWEGRVVEGRFPLLKRLGGNENFGSYLTVLQGLHEAVIELISTDSAQEDADLAQWDLAMSLSHPHLEKILARGRCVIDAKALVYVVSERCSTNLAKTIESGSIAADRSQEIFDPIVNALSYLHSNGVIHGHVNPSNIHLAGSKPRLAITDLLIAGSVKRKISAPGNYDAPELWQGEASAAADIWSLGITMWEAMAGAPPSWDLWREDEPEVPESLPSPFREIVRESLRLDPLRRCTLQSVQERLSANNAMPLSEGSIPTKEDKPVIEGPVVNGILPATAPIATSEVPIIAQPAARFSASEEIETDASSEPALFSGTLTHFEEAHLPQSRVVPYAAVVLLAVIGIGAFLFVREHKAGASSRGSEQAAAISEPTPQKQATAPAAPAAEQTAPAQPAPATDPAASQEQDKDVPQAQPASGPAAQAAGVSQPQSSAQPAETKRTPQDETQSAATVNQPVPPAPASGDRERTQENAKGLVEKRVLPTVSPGARGGMRRPIEVLIRVSVNPEGTVSDAAYVVPGRGNYFARIAQRAALSWKFKPPVQNGDRERSVWMLRFNFGRAGTEATATEQEE